MWVKYVMKWSLLHPQNCRSRKQVTTPERLAAGSTQCAHQDSPGRIVSRATDQVTRQKEKHCVYLGNLQQYDAVLDGLYHALEGDGTGVQSQAGDTTSEVLRGRRVRVSLTHVVSFKFSTFCRKKKDRGKQVVKSHNFKKTELYKGQLTQEFQHWCNANAMQGFLNADTAAFISVSQISPAKFLKRNNNVCHIAVTTSERKWITWLPVNNRIKIKLKTWKVTGCVWSTLRKPLLVSDVINLNN